MSGFLSIAGAGMSAKGQQEAADASADAQNANADFLVQQGIQRRNITIEQAQEKERQATQRAGTIRAAYGAAGVDPNSGSPLAVMADQATQGELARQLTLFQGKADQQSANTQAAINKAQAKAMRQAGYVSAMGTLFSGVGSALSASGGGGGAGVPKGG